MRQSYLVTVGGSTISVAAAAAIVGPFNHETEFFKYPLHASSLDGILISWYNLILGMKWHILSVVDVEMREIYSMNRVEYKNTTGNRISIAQNDCERRVAKNNKSFNHTIPKHTQPERNTHK